MPHRSLPRSDAPSIEDLIARRALSAVFQPIVEFEDGAILGYEGLIRGPAGSPLETPFALFALANAEGRVLELERAAALTCVQAFAQSACEGKLFLNFSAEAILKLGETRDATLAWLVRLGLPVERLVVELT